MANRKHLLHVKSSVAETAKQYGIDNFLVTPKKPVDSSTGKATDDTLMYGEIAVNYGKGVEALTIRNTEDDVIAFVNENDFNEAGEITAAGLAAEKTERESADAIEKFERETADTTEKTERIEADAAEKTAREAADATEKAERQAADATEKTAREEAFNQLNDKIDNLEVSGMVSTTYAEIKSLREQSKLKPGQFYRITDYVTTTVQSNTQSAGHAFDVIVRADSESVLNENAFAIQHEGDTYFANQKLSAWELKYDINNDTNKYAWADETNGKGVIYYMKDENDNECPYDFKNIQFKVGAKQQAGTVANVFYYTFSVATGVNDATVTDYSLNGGYCYGNKMGLYVTSNKRSLNTNVFRNTSATSSCYGNTFGNRCYGNTFGSSCNQNTFGSSCNQNTFGNGCGGNTFGNSCGGNTFGDNCGGNTFGRECENNTFGSRCGGNTFGRECENNTFGNGCGGNTFGNGFNQNTFGHNCSKNTFGHGCSSNTFGSSCGGNMFGRECENNMFGRDCENNTFGNGCGKNTFGTASAAKDFYQNIIFENGVQYVNLDCAQTTSYSAKCQNVLVGMGIAGTSSNKKTLTVAATNNAFKTVFKTANDVEVTA